ncbi:hypothetical protein RNJ44_02118 [Nakaseomyces bracarensis]|uniref:Uncharacterized protein n=1 Tax=Nakaseomyces bracarensis TaxID=273131 RepID=A0ABR4NMQ4_9SACH
MVGRSYTVVTNTPVSGKVWCFRHKTARRSVTHGDISLDLSDAFLQWVTNRQKKLKLENIKSQIYLGWVSKYRCQQKERRWVPLLPSQTLPASNTEQNSIMKGNSQNLKDLIFRTNKTIYNVDSNKVKLKAGLSKRYKSKKTFS